ncbi:tyrosine--tRNA ligase [Striga asiatica]|uniref:Tyrosine--tRNA ligase n=1 Tax=Striga asiatica TaxID=4170 RepID=A0A5A7PBU2_STRAF|nr:tyrosine--tRNA ligase [Striga asiatica]
MYWNHQPSGSTANAACRSRQQIPDVAARRRNRLHRRRLRLLQFRDSSHAASELAATGSTANAARRTRQKIPDVAARCLNGLHRRRRPILQFRGSSHAASELASVGNINGSNL